ncbi:MAG: hypothetical protein WB709_11910, partial [Solirubrobacteraceae bacterium]
MSGKRGVIIVFAVVGIAVYLMSNGATTPSSSPAQAGNATPAATPSTPAAKLAATEDAANNTKAASPSDTKTADSAPASKWTYRDQGDELRGITWHFATLE